MDASDADALDEQFARLLETCDEALAAGQTLPPLDDRAVPEALRSRLRNARTCLQRLNALWPRAQRSTRDTATEEAAVVTTEFEVRVVPEWVGRFRILDELGRGGMGVVYLAQQPELNRPVALKMIRSGVFAGAHELARFRAEAGAVARLQHPGVVQIYEVGEAEGQPYLVLEYLDGGSLASHLQGEPQPPRLAAALVEQLARAADHAHRRGIVHRDLKPANILLSAAPPSPEGGPRPRRLDLSACLPKIADFGLAKHLGAGAARTETGVVLGTPWYMAPEQAGAGRREVGPAADIYGLGAVLYELLTGRPPFRGESLAETLDQVRTQEPVPPRRLQAGLSRDLETVCLKCLEKEPGKRYASAADLADDLARWLAGEPVRARPVGRAERLGRWCGRNRATATACGLAAAALAAVVMVSFLWAVRESDGAARLAQAADALRREQGQTAEALAASERNRRESERQTAGLTLERGLALCEQGDVSRGLLWMARALTLLPDGSEDLEWVIRANLEGWSRRLHPLRAVLGQRGQVLAVAFSPDSRSVWTTSAHGTARRWETSSGRPIGPALPHGHGAHGLALSPDGRTLLTLAAQGGMPSNGGTNAGFTCPSMRWAAGGEAQFWDASTGRPLELFLRDSGHILTAVFSPDGRTVLTGHRDKRARLWEARTGNPVGRPFPTDGEVWAVAFSPDGSMALTASSEGTTQLWETATGKPVGAPLRQPSWSQWIWSATFSPDGRTILIGKSDNTAQAWDRATGKLGRIFPRQRGGIYAAVFSPDGRSALTGGGDRTARLWDVDTGTQLGPALRHGDVVQAVSFSPDGRWIVTGGWDHTARLWERAAEESRRVALQGQGEIAVAVLSRDGSTVLTAGEREARLWRTATGEAVGQPLRHGDGIGAMAISPDGRTLLTGSRDQTARLWEAATGSPLGGPLRHAADVLLVAFSPDGQSFLTAEGGGRVQVWETATRRPLGDGFTLRAPARTVRYSPDGKLLLALDTHGQLYLREVGTGREVGRAGPYQSRDFQAAFSPDGRSVLIRDGGGVRRWEVGTGREAFRPLRQADGGGATMFSPGGRLLLSAYGDSTARFWDALTGWPIGAPHRREGLLSATSFSGDGATLWISSPLEPSGSLVKVPVPLEGQTERLVLWAQVITGMELDPDEVERVLGASDWQERSRRLQGLCGPPRVPRLLTQPE
jgi:WD40 repeat protein